MTVTPISLTVSDAAASIGVGRKEIYDAINAEELPCRRRGRRIVIEVEDLKAWVRSWPREAEPRA